MLYARQAGFLHATPKDQPVNRYEGWRQAGVTDFGLPELDPGEYMIDLLFEIGPIRQSGEVVAPTDWDIIAPFSQMAELDTDDTFLLAKMCRGYHEFLMAGVNQLAKEPAEIYTETADANG